MVMVPQQQAIQLITQVMEHLADWPMRSAETFRNAVLGDCAFAVNPMLDIHDDKEAQFIRRMLEKTVAEGRMIDFGYIPNDVIKAESTRSRKMFEAGELMHPYESWLAVTTWEGGFNGYYITPHPQWAGAILVLELYGVTFPQADNVILVYDMVSINVNGVGDTIVSPAVMKYPIGVMESDQELRNRGANSLDPMVTMLRLLADASIPIVSKAPPEKLNKARAKQGKWPIPGHTIVNTKDYVANFTSSAATRGISKGGTHASPIAHWRRAHQRHLADGRIVTVKSSKVNWRDNEELHRLFYHIKGKDKNEQRDKDA